jgi:glycosyltransferase involved in cell wall biosynthesis
MGEVSIVTVVPVLDEAKHLDRCLKSLRSQTYDSAKHRILVLDGGSCDNSLEIAQYHAEDSRNNGGPLLEILDNPKMHVAPARNLALEKIGDATHMFEIIGHTWVPEDHLQLRIDDLLDFEETLGISIGSMGTQVLADSQESGVVASAIESALHSPLGGSGQFARFSGRGPATSPAFCIHNVEAVKSIGGWDERWVVGQDHDLNHRISEAGWAVMRSDVSSVVMSKRSTFAGLWGMGRRYGHWRMRQLRAYPSRLRIREFMPWFGLIATLTCLLVSEVYSSSLFTSISLGLIGTYVSILTLVGLIEQAKKPLFFGMIPGFFICLVVVSLFLLHVSFSFGLLTGFLGLKSPTNERVMGTNNSSNRGVE